MVYGNQEDAFAEFKRAHKDYKVYDAHYESIGKADELFVDAEDHPLYIGVKTGFLDANIVLVPLEIIRINDKRHVVEISAEADQIRHAPSLGDNEELSPDLEARVHGYFGLSTPLTIEHERAVHPDPLREEELAEDTRIDVEPGERQETTPHFEAAPPPLAGDPDLRQEAPSTHAEQVSPPREPGKEWARGTERLPVEDGTGDAIIVHRPVKVRRLRRQ